MKYFTFIVLSILLTNSSSISAHEFWLEAHPFYQKNNGIIDISIHVGEELKGELLPNIPAWYKEFNVITENGLQDIEGELGRDPAGYFSHQTQGVYAIGYLSTENNVTLDAKKFTTYLKTQGLEKIIQRRKELGESESKGRENFYRNVKTIIKMGDNQDVNFYNYDFGHRLNINPLQNPYELTKGDELRVQITFDQKPAANLLLQAIVEDLDGFKFNIRTDKQGYATIPLAHKGVWLFHTVDMIRSTKKDIDWESYWGSLTFKIF